MSGCESPLGRAFTLVEALVVVAVVGVLAGLVTPVLLAARAASKSSACISNLQQLYAACSMYASDNNGYLPPYQNQMNVSVNAGPGKPFYDLPDTGEELVQSLAPYIRTNDIWFCPSDRFARTDSTEGYLRHRFASYKIELCLGAWEVLGVVSLERGVRCLNGAEVLERPLLKDSLWDYFPNRPKPPYSHSGSFNFVFLDGHAKSYPWEGGLW